MNKFYINFLCRYCIIFQNFCKGFIQKKKHLQNASAFLLELFVRISKCSVFVSLNEQMSRNIISRNVQNVISFFQHPYLITCGILCACIVNIKSDNTVFTTPRSVVLTEFVGVGKKFCSSFDESACSGKIAVRAEVIHIPKTVGFCSYSNQTSVKKCFYFVVVK